MSTDITDDSYECDHTHDYIADSDESRKGDGEFV